MNNDYNLNNNNNIDNPQNNYTNQDSFNNANNANNVNVYDSVNNPVINNNEVIKEEVPSIPQEQPKGKEIDSYSGIIIVLISIIGFILFLLGNIYGLGIGIICVLLSLFQIKKNPPFISVAILLSILLVGLYIVGTILSAEETSSYLYRSRSLAYIDIAKGYIDSARVYVKNEKKVGCKEYSVSEEKIELNKLESVSKESPFNNMINEDKSYVIVKTASNSTRCMITYSIYITDGEYRIGREDSPLKYEELDISSIEKD